MGVACLQLPNSRLHEYAAVFKSRAAALTAALREHAGWDCAMPKACVSGSVEWGCLGGSGTCF